MEAALAAAAEGEEDVDADDADDEMELLIGQLEYWNDSMVELVEDKKSEALSIRQLLQGIDTKFAEAR